MRLIIDNIDDVIAKQIAISAQQHSRSIEEEVSCVLKERFSRMASAERLKDFHNKLLSKRGGVPFPDSVNLIREMRDND